MASAPGIGVIFDCDGTLLDSMEMWHTLDDRIAERAGVVFTKEDKDFLTAGTLRECGDYMHAKYAIGTSGEDVERMIRDEIISWYRTEATPKPGVMEFVTGLHAAGVPMAVASSTPAHILRIGMETSGLAPYMRAVVSVEDVGAPKREPLVYDTARAALGTDRAHTWGFEDAVYALETLARAGYPTVGIYDSDIAGTPEQLAKVATRTIRSFSDVSADGFLRYAETA